MKRLYAAVLIILFVAIDWLTFHDLSEPHTVRDWLTLLVSLPILYSSMKTLIHT